MLRSRLGASLVVATLIVAGGCGSQSGREEDSDREASRISEAAHAGGTTVQFKVPCAPDLEVALVEERDDAVVLSATHVPPPDGIYAACLEGFRVELDAPLGERLLIDQDGEVVEVTQVDELEETEGFREVD